MKERRKREIKNRKNFLPTLGITVLLWLILAGLIYFADPETFGVVFIFFAIFFFTVLFTFSLVFANTRRGLIITIGITLFLILRYFGVGNLLNGLLIAGVTLASEIYFWYSTAK